MREGVSNDERLLLSEGGLIAMSRQMVELSRRLHNIEQMLVRLLDVLERITAFWIRAPEAAGTRGGPCRVGQRELTED